MGLFFKNHMIPLSHFDKRLGDALIPFMSARRSERGPPLSAPGFSPMMERAAASAKLGIKAHAHMLYHECGFKLANDGHDTRAYQAYLGQAQWPVCHRRRR